MSVDFVILAAGNGSRMNSSLPKFFQTIAGKPVICYIIDTCHDYLRTSNETGRVIVVTRDDLKDSEYFNDVDVAIQSEPLGTADALSSALDLLRADHCVVLSGDMPLIETRHLFQLVGAPTENSIIAMTIPGELSSMPYGRVVLGDGMFDKIVEYKNASESERLITIANSGVYKIRTGLLRTYLPQIRPDEISGELYLTDIFSVMKNDGISISVIESPDYWPFHGVNTMNDLAKAESIIQGQLKMKFLEQGVKLIAPDSVYFSYDTLIDRDVVIEPNVFIGPNVRIGKDSRINAFSHIVDCEINDNVEVGPFARIRGNSVLMDHSSVGNFVEVKDSVFSEKAKAKHLSYIGDTTVGKNVNIGAGTITCNYDGVKKYKTSIGDNAFIGSNSTLVAPVTIGAGSIVGAGSVITKTVDQNALAISRAQQVQYQNGAVKIWRKKGRI